MGFATVRQAVDPDVIAPDSSEIRVLCRTGKASTAHGTLAPGGVSLAIVHPEIEEIWYVLSGRAEIWRKLGDRDEIVEATSGISLTIPAGTQFQFRTLGDEPFRFIMMTMPPWSGDGDAVRVPDRWPVE